MPPKLHNSKSPLSNLLQKIDAICVVCNESQDTPSLLDTFLHKTLDLLNARRGKIFLLDEHTKELALKAACGVPKSDEKQDNGSLMTSPLMIKDQIIGMIHIAGKVTNKPFTQRESQFLGFLSHQLALNCQRISMLKKLESQERLASLGKLAGGIAHEFNNPLDGVMRYNNLCMSRVQDDEVLREYLLEVQLGLKRMANIVRNLLACARQAPGSIAQVDLHKSIEQSLKELNPYLVSKNITLTRNFSSNLPEITDWGIERIISNLIKNAIEAVDKNGCVEVTTAANNGFIDIQVADNGRGIAEGDLERIFEPFFTTKDIDKGCGLGLTVVNEIVKYYNGKIKVKSRLNEGTTFTVRIPVK